MRVARMNTRNMYIHNQTSFREWPKPNTNHNHAQKGKPYRHIDKVFFATRSIEICTLISGIILPISISSLCHTHIFINWKIPLEWKRNWSDLVGRNLWSLPQYALLLSVIMVLNEFFEMHLTPFFLYPHTSNSLLYLDSFGGHTSCFCT